MGKLKTDYTLPFFPLVGNVSPFGLVGFGADEIAATRYYYWNKIFNLLFHNYYTRSVKDAILDIMNLFFINWIEIVVLKLFDK